MLCPRCQVTMLEGQGTLGGHPLESLRLGATFSPGTSRRLSGTLKQPTPWSCPECFGLFLEGPHVQPSRTVQGVVSYPPGF